MEVGAMNHYVVTGKHEHTKLTLFHPPPGGATRIAISVSVCLSVRSHISKTTRQDFVKFFVRVRRGRGSVPR